MRTRETLAPALALGLCASVSLGALVARADAPLDPVAAVAAVAERVRVHDDVEARARLDALAPSDRGSLAARYLRARLEERMGNVAEAAAAYEGVAVDQLPEGLRAETELRRARLDARAGRCARARPVLLALVRTTPAVAPLARALAAECAATLGDHASAVAELAVVLEAARGARDANDASDARDVDFVSTSRLRARSLVALRRVPEAVACLREAYVRAPAHPDADVTLASLVALDPSATTFDVETRYAIVARLLEARQPERALALVDAIATELGATPSTPPTSSTPAARATAAADPATQMAARARYLHTRAEVLFSMRSRYAEAARAYDEARLLGGPTAGYDEFYAARATSRADRDAEAVERYDAFATNHPRDERAREALWLAAWLSLREGGPVADAQRRMRAFVTSTSVERDRVVTGTFLLAMDSLERSDPAAAMAWLERSCEHPTGDLEGVRCRYWGAFTAHAMGDRVPAEAALRRLARTDAFEWYGLLARRRLRELGRPEEPSALARPAAPSEALTLPDDVAFLAGLGLDEDAARHLRSHERTLRGAAGPNAMARLVATYLALGDAARAYSLSRAGNQASNDAFLFASMHPMPHAEVVSSLATSLGLDPAYVFGTMRQESAFDAAAVSRVGAIGLLQLMPETGRRSANRASLPTFDASMLFDPTMNIRLGMVEMHALEVRYHGSIALIAAAYNGGESKVDAWRRERPNLPLDLFVERIPFEETRGYVRRVVSHTARYRALSGHPELGTGLVENPLP